MSAPVPTGVTTLPATTPSKTPPPPPGSVVIDAERPVTGTLALLALAASSLLRKREKAFALGGALALTVALAASVLFLTEALRSAADRVRSSAPDLVVQRLVAGRPTLIDAALVEKIRGIDAVREARARVWGYVFLPPVQANVVVVGIQAGSPPLAAVNGALDRGREPQSTGEAVMGAALANALGASIDDEIRLPSVLGAPSPPIRVVGIFSSPAEVYTADVVLVPEATARALLGVSADEAVDLAVDLTNPAEARIVARTITERIEGVRIVDRELMARVHELAFGRRGGLALAALLPALLALLVLGWDRLSSLGAEERREIAVLKAVGFSTRDVVFVRMSESALLAVVATALGIAAAHVWVFVLGAPGLRAAIAGFGVLQGETPLVPTLDIAQLFGLALGVVAPFVVLSIVPAWRAAIADPMESMRG